MPGLQFSLIFSPSQTTLLLYSSGERGRQASWTVRNIINMSDHNAALLFQQWGTIFWFVSLLAKYFTNQWTDFVKTFIEQSLHIYNWWPFGDNLIQNGCHNNATLANTKMAKTNFELNFAVVLPDSRSKHIEHASSLFKILPLIKSTLAVSKIYVETVD